MCLSKEITFSYSLLSAAELQDGIAFVEDTHRRVILLVQMKKVTSMKYGSSTSSWKPRGWASLDLILMMRYIYINSNMNSLTKSTSSSRSKRFKDIFPWNIFQMITKTILISTRVFKSYTMKRDILFSVWWKVNVNWNNYIISISQWRENLGRRNTSIKT